MLKKLPFIFFLLCIFHLEAQSQDLQYSQYYNAPLFLNPAFAGTGNNTRFIFDYRNQWPNLYNPYKTYSFSFDHRIEPINSGVGLIVRKDVQGAARLSATEIGGIYSYIVGLSQDWAFIPAIQVSWVNRSLNYQNLIFGDQIDLNNPISPSPSNDPFAINNKMNYLDFSAGGVLFRDDFWFGVSLNHLNRPDQSFTGKNFDRVPVKTTLNLGYKIYFEKSGSKDYREKSLTPTFLYKTQGNFDQLDIGVYGIYAPIMLGFWYRGIPVKKYSREYNNHDALVFLVGINAGPITFGYSYDLTISTLSAYSGGSHEISLIYEFYKHYKVKKIQKRLPCPSFYKRRLIN